MLGGRGVVAPSDKVNIAIVGVGGQGRWNARELMKQADAQIIAVADPAEHWDLETFYFRGRGGREPVRAEIEKHFAEKTPNFRCAAYEDFRVMLEKEKAIDAILCATPDHLHAYVTLLAMRQGKHVYCEKPLTHDIAEARLVAQVAKESRVATQMGNQGHSRDTIRETCEWIWDGAIGQVNRSPCLGSHLALERRPGRQTEGGEARAAGIELGPVAGSSRTCPFSSGLRAGVVA